MAQNQVETNEWDEPILTIGGAGPAQAAEPSTGGLQPRSKSPVTRRRESSFAAVVADLDVGEVASRTHHLNSEMTLAELAVNMPEMKAMIRNNATPAVTQARKRTGGEYRIETAETITPSGRIYLLVLVTRTA